MTTTKKSSFPWLAIPFLVISIPILAAALLGNVLVKSVLAGVAMAWAFLRSRRQLASDRRNGRSHISPRLVIFRLGLPRTYVLDKAWREKFKGRPDLLEKSEKDIFGLTAQKKSV